MNVSLCSCRLFAALWGVALGPLVQVSLAADRAVASIPADAHVCVSASGLGDRASWLLSGLKGVFSSPLVKKNIADDLPSVQAGLELAEYALRSEAAAAVYLPGAEGGPPALLLAVHAGDQTAALEATLHRLLAATGHPADAQDEVDIGGVAFRSQPLDDGPTLLWATHEGVFLLATSEQAARKAVATRQGQAPALAASEEFKLCESKLGPAGGAARWDVFVNTAPLLAALRADMDQEAARFVSALGLNDWKSLCLRFDDSPLGGRLSAYAHIAPSAQLTFLLRQAPLTDEDLAVVPKDAFWASVGSFDLAQSWEGLSEVLATFNPDLPAQVDAGIAMAAQLLGFSPTDDLLPAFGPKWAFYDTPQHGGILFTGVALVNDARDPEALHGMLARVVQYLTPLAAQNDVRLQLKQMEDRGHTVHYVLVGGLPIPVAPAWGAAGGRWVFALFPQTAALALRQADPATRGASLLDQEDFRAARAALPQPATSVAYANSRYFHRTFYAFKHLLNTALASTSAGGEAPFDLAAMPVFPEELAGVRNFVSAQGHDDDGFLYRSVGVTPLTFFFTGDSGVASIALLISVLLPSLSRARELAKRAVSASNLRGLGQGCHIYASDHDERFPPDLATLVNDGMATPGMLCSLRDPDAPDAPSTISELGSIGTDRSSYFYIAGQTESADARNILAYERIVSDEGTNALFVDGYVTWMRLPEFKQALQQTYQRLGREDEIPAELRP